MSSNSSLSKRESENAQLENLVDERVVAKFYGVSLATVRRWRWLRTGPKFHKIGTLCRYRMADLEEYLRGTRTGGGSQAEAR